MRSARLFVLALALVSTVVSGTAQAATPPEGKLSKSRKTLSWTGTFTLSEPNSLGGCLLGTDDPICDHFFLKIDLPDGARIRIDLPTPSATTDLDLYVYSPNGTEVASSGGFLVNERAEFRHSGRFRNKPYEVQIVPWLVTPGTTYKAKASVR